MLNRYLTLLNNRVRLRSHRARWLTLAVAAVLITALFGATGGAASAPTLVVDTSFTLRTADPQRALDPTAYIVDRAIYDTLFTYVGSDLEHPVPLLVRSWSASDDAKTYRFELKRNVHFANGTQLTARDVVFSLDRLANLKGNPSYLVGGMTVTARGRYAVVIHSAVPSPQLPAILASPPTGIVNSALVRQHGGTAAADAAVADKAENWLNSSSSVGAGSGPYTLKTYSTTSQVVLSPNQHYWGATKPAFSSVVIRNMLAAEQLLNVQRGSHEIAIDLSSDQAQTLQHNKHVKVSLRPSTWVFYLFANDDQQVSTITPNVKFQQAVRYALDYKGLLSVAGAGAIQAPGVVASMINGALEPKDATRQDLSRSKSQLAASGVGGQQVTLEYPTDLTINGVSPASLAQKVQASLQAAGFDVALSGSPASIYIPKFRAGKVAFGLSAWAPDFADPADYLPFTPGMLLALHAGWPAGSDPALERLATEASTATGFAARKSIYQRLQLALNRDGPFFPLLQPTQVFVATADLNHAAFNGAYDVDVTAVS